LVVDGRWLGVTITTVLVVFFVLAAKGNYRVRMNHDTASRVPLIGCAVASGGSAALLLVATPFVAQPPLHLFANLLGALFVSGLLAEVAGAAVLRRQWMRGNLRAAALVYGDDPLAREVAIEISVRRDYGVDVVGVIAHFDDCSNFLSGRVFNRNVDIGSVIDLTGADRLIIAPGDATLDREAVSACRLAASRGLAVFVVPRFFEMGLGMDSMSPDRVRGYPLVRLQRAAHPQLSMSLKRGFDVVVAGMFLLTIAPLMALIATLVKVTSPGPIFFTQKRIGQHGRPIMVNKFRSMTTSETSDTEWTAENRVTPVGRAIRRLNLDELPQLYSVLRGDMSLVGPRPERPAFVDRFRIDIDEYDDRHRMPVGITGLAQIAGLRGDTSIAERIKYDNLYIDQWSFTRDVEILLKTLVAIIHQTRYANQIDEVEHALNDPSVTEKNAIVSRAA
jgi:exopolysaccharide biosynthesis polyprenyl glycosylphosphotransferase